MGKGSGLIFLGSIYAENCLQVWVSVGASIPFIYLHGVGLLFFGLFVCLFNESLKFRSVCGSDEFWIACPESEQNPANSTILATFICRAAALGNGEYFSGFSWNS